MKPSNRLHLVGQRFGQLVVVALTGCIRGRSRWTCDCDCGRRCFVSGDSLVNHGTKSCGCLQRKTATSHGMSYSPEYEAWRQALARCRNPRHRAWKRYGGRGITMCDEWTSSFEAFLAHIGPRPSADHSVDRIKNDRGYEPGNVRWATRIEQARNRKQRTREGAAA